MLDHHYATNMDEDVFIGERRMHERQDVESEATISILSKGENLPKEKILYTLGKDISVSGARIQSSTFLPVNTLLHVRIAINDTPEMITAFGKVKWNKILLPEEFYEAGLEFVNTLN